MRKILAVIFAAIWCGSLSFAQDSVKESPQQITLDQALEIAFRQSPEIKAALAQINKARSAISEASANFNPKFNAELTHTRQGPSVSFTVPGLGSVDVVQDHNTTGVVSFMLPIDISKKLGYISDIAKYQFQLDYLALLVVSQKLLFDTKTAYYDLLRAQGQEEVAQAAVDAATARLKDASARYAAGAAPKFDVTRAQVDVANLNQQLIRAKSRVAIARAALNRTIGLDINTPTEVVKSEIKVEDIKVEIDKSIQEAYAKRPEVRSAETLVDLSKRNVKLQRTGILPTLAATANYTYNFRVAGFSSTNESWIALLDLKIPIWDGGVTKAKVDQANAEVDKSVQNLENIKLGVALAVKTAALVLQEGIERIATTSENVAMAEEALRLATIRYNSGIATLVEVSDAELALTQAKTEWVNARYDYMMGLAGLERAIGNQPELAKLQLLTTGPVIQR
ncbi:MAG: TolC family protein [Armatimonadetes bacterium]|nr:TolC family protein [Armatimonadota bacterium]